MFCHFQANPSQEFSYLVIFLGYYNRISSRYKYDVHEIRDTKVECYSKKMSIKIKNKIDEVVFTAVDSKYFKKYAYAWAWSIYKNEMHGHIHVIDPSEKDIKNLKKLQINSRDKIKFSTGDIDLNLPKDKCYFASFRFLYIDRLSHLYNKILITDVDSIIREKIKFPYDDFGFFLRDPLESENEWYVESSRLAAGIFYINIGAVKKFNFKQSYLNNLLQLKESNQWEWMIDQNALHKVFLELTELNSYKIKKFTEKDLCWEFKDSSKIWTGKGARKYKSKKYLKENKKYLNNYFKTARISFIERALNFIYQL